MPGPSPAAANTPVSGDAITGADRGGGVRVLRSAEELAAVREAWLHLQTDQVAVDPDFYAAALLADPKIVRPHLVVLDDDNGTPRAMLVARIESLELGVRAGYRTVYNPRVRALTVVYGGILGDVDEDAFRLLLGSVQQSLSAREADVAIFRYLPLESPFYRIASTAGTVLTQQRGFDPVVHWELKLTGTLDDVIAGLSKTSRKNIKWYRNRLDRDYGDKLTIRVFREPSELDELLRDVEVIAAKTYQRALGLSFGDTPAHRERTRVSMEHGWFWGWVMYLDGRPSAFQHGELYGGRFRLGRPGYDPEFAQQRIGTYLLLRVIGDLCEDEDAIVLDYGSGDADYKRRLGTQSWQEANVMIFAPTLRGITVNVIRTVLLSSISLVKRVLGKGELYRKIKRGWRDRVSGADAETKKAEPTAEGGEPD